MLETFVQISDHESVLLISVSSLPQHTSEEDITSYFERQGDEAEVCSVQIHGNGQATVKLIGLTEQGRVPYRSVLSNFLNHSCVFIQK